MRRALEPSEEQDVLRLLRETAYKVNIPQPMDFDSWHRSKGYLQADTSGDVPPGWDADRYRWIRQAACLEPTLWDCLKRGPTWVRYCHCSLGARKRASCVLDAMHG